MLLIFVKKKKKSDNFLIFLGNLFSFANFFELLWDVD